MYNFRTDLADERTDIISKNSSQNNDGILIEKNTYSETIDVCRVKVLNELGSEKIDKKIGNYITINMNNLELIDTDNLNKIIDVVFSELSTLIKDYNSFLIVGLGNEETIADSVGPKVIKDLEITRHLIKYKPELIPSNIKEISAIAPGVLGTTGIETQEIIKSIVEKINFDAIIVIDALSSCNISRLLSTIQLCDTGIVPGSGVSNKRKEISFETMGIPVIALGVPTVVSSATIVADTLDILARKFDEFNFIKNSTHQDKQKLIETILEPANYNLTVMPKDVDVLVDNMKQIISSSLNKISGL